MASNALLPSSHVDTFVRAQLPPPAQWPTFICNSLSCKMAVEPENTPRIKFIETRQKKDRFSYLNSYCNKRKLGHHQRLVRLDQSNACLKSGKD